MTMFVQMDFGHFGDTPLPAPTPAALFAGVHKNFECVPPVFIHRAITCDSFKVLDKKKKKKKT